VPSRPWAKPGQGAQRHSVSQLRVCRLSRLKLFPLKIRRGRREGPGDCVGSGEAFEEVQDLAACRFHHLR